MVLVLALEAEKATPYTEKVSIHKRMNFCFFWGIEFDKIHLLPSG